MNIKFESPVIFVKDIKESKKFYEEHLNQKVRFDFGSNIAFESGLSLWEHKSAHKLIFDRETEKISMPERSQTFELYFESDNIEEAFESIKQLNVKFIQILHQEPWGQQSLRFYDPDKYIVEIGESLDSWVKRFYKKNMTAKEIAEKTTLPLKVIEGIIKKIK